MRSALLAALSLVTVAACDGSIETVDGMKTNDPLYAEVVSECGEDALVLRVVDLSEDEALCCYDYGRVFTGLHCMTASGASVTNPNGLSRVQEISRAQKKAKAVEEAKKD